MLFRSVIQDTPETMGKSLYKTEVTVLEDFTTEVEDTVSILLKEVQNSIPVINFHSSIRRHPVLLSIPNLRVKSASYDILTNIKAFSQDLQSSSKIFNSRSTGKDTTMLSEGIIFETGSKLVFTNMKGKNYSIKDVLTLKVSPGSFVINVSKTAIPGTIPMKLSFGFQLMTYLQRVTHPWSAAPVVSFFKKSFLLPKLTVLATRPVEEVTSFLFSLSENITLNDFANALDRTSYFSDYNTVRNLLRAKVQSLTFPTHSSIIISDFDEVQTRLAETILLLEVDSFRDLNSNLLL